MRVAVVVVPSLVTGSLWSWFETFLILVAVVLSLLVLSENISLLYTLYTPTRWRTSHSSKTCCWVCVWFSHALHVWVWYLYLELFFTGSILFRVLKMVLDWGLVNFSCSWPTFGAPSLWSPPIGVGLWVCCCFLFPFFSWNILSFCCLLCASQLFFPSVSPSSTPNSYLAFLVSSAHFVIMVLFVVNLFILWLAPLIMLCSISTVLAV